MQPEAVLAKRRNRIQKAGTFAGMAGGMALGGPVGGAIGAHLGRKAGGFAKKMAAADAKWSRKTIKKLKTPTSNTFVNPFTRQVI